MARYIDVDALWKDVTSNIDYCADFLEIIERQPTVTINDHPDEIKVTNCNHNADDSKMVSFSRDHENGKDIINRQDAIRWIKTECNPYGKPTLEYETSCRIMEHLDRMPSAQPDLGKYEYHYDHTDCIWYRPEARNRCPATCAQYRDGWNDAMNYIFRDGKGYRPYRRGKQYEE